MRFKILFLACISSIIISCADNSSVNNGLPISGENIPPPKENSEPTNLVYSGEYEVDGLLVSANTVSKQAQIVPDMYDIATSVYLKVTNNSNKEASIELNESFFSDSINKNKILTSEEIKNRLQKLPTTYEKICNPFIKLLGHLSGIGINFVSMGLASSLTPDIKTFVEELSKALLGIESEQEKTYHTQEQLNKLMASNAHITNNKLTLKAGESDSILLFFDKVGLAKTFFLTTVIQDPKKTIQIELSPEGTLKQTSKAVERIEPTLSTGEKQIIQTNTSGEEKTPIPSVSSVLVQKTTNIPTPPNFSTDKNPTPLPEESIPNGKPTISPVLVPDGKPTIFPTPPDFSTGEKPNTLPQDTLPGEKPKFPPTLPPDISTGEKQNTQPPPQLDIPTGEKENSLPSLSPAQ